MAFYAVILPSRTLRAVVLTYAFLQFGAAALCLAGAFGPMRAPALVAAFCILAGAALVGALARLRVPRAIELIDPNALRVSVQPSHGAATACRMEPGSSYWPGLLLLVLRDAQGRQFSLPIARDSLAPDLFRILARMCRKACEKKD